MPSRRQELLDAALEAFTEDGYEGTPVSAIVSRAGMSKAAFTYHFKTKDSLLIELTSPLLGELEQVVRDTGDVEWPQGVRDLLGRYLDALSHHRKLVIWMDGDKSVLNHPVVGPRLSDNNEAMRRLIAGSRERDARVSAAAALGAIWRPVRNLSEIDLTSHKGQLLDAAMAAAMTARPTA